MRAAVHARYGPPEVVAVRDIPAPVAGPRDVIVRVAATTVSSGDARLRACRMPSPLFWVLGRLVFGILRPRRGVLGSELAGTVEAIGAEVDRFAVGDEVMAYPGGRYVAHAELVRMPEDAAIVKKPGGLSFEEAAAIPFGGSAALHFLRDIGRVRQGERVLINGASGSVGVMAVQIARHLGAEVTGVCSGRNVELVRSLGAERVIDYTEQDFTRGPERYDVVFDTIGSTTLRACRGVLAPRGRFLAAVMTLTELRQMITTRFGGGPRLLGGVAPETSELLGELGELASSGRIRAVIGSRHTLDHIVEAHRLADSGRKVGAAVVVMGDAGA